MTTHELKCWPESFWAIITGVKRLELRKDDRGYQAGDKLVLREFIPCNMCKGTGRMWDNGDKFTCDKCKGDGNHGEYTGSGVRCVVTHVMQGGQFGLEKGYVAMSITVSGLQIDTMPTKEDFDERARNRQANAGQNRGG